MDFKNVDKKYRPIPFWSWNEKLDTEETRRQIREMDSVGIGGFFMHARGGLQTEYLGDEWFDNVEASIDESKKLGMHPYAYDENGWPSGFGGGAVNALGIEYQQKYLRMEDSFEHKDTAIGKCGEHYFYYDVNEFYVDTLDKKVIKKFIEVAYQPYYDKYGTDCEGFFTDEPQISRNGIPWSFVFESEYKERYNEDIKEHLEELFLNIGNYADTRIKFWKMVTDLFSSAYMKQIYDWCDERGVNYTGHLVMEENLYSQIFTNGACMPHYEYMHIPGMDWLGRNIRNNLVQYQLSSVAEQFDKKQILSETFALCGHNVSLAELKGIYEWQMVRGINLLCQHLEGYSLRGIRKRDYPPAMYLQQPWWAEYGKFNDAMSRIGMLIAEGRKHPDVLVLHPETTAWTMYNDSGRDEIDVFHNKFMETIDKLEKKKIVFHLGDETIMERHAKVENGKIIIGCQSYSTLIMDDCKYLLDTTKAIIEEFKKQGGTITTAKELEKNDITDRESLTYTVRYFDDFTMHYFVNTSDERFDASFSVKGKKLDIYTGDLNDFSGKHQFEPWGSLIIIEDGSENSKAEPDKNYISIEGEMDIAECTPNSLTLDYCDYYFDGVLQEENGYVLNICNRACALGKKVNIRQDYKIEIKDIPSSLCLVTETPEIFEISVNGTVVDKTVTGYFRDKSFKTIDIQKYVKTGENVITFVCDFEQREATYRDIERSYGFESNRNKLSYDMEIEACYLIGDFSVETNGKWTSLERKASRYNGSFVIAEPKKKINVKNIEKQGFPFFSGELTLEGEIDISDENTCINLDIRGVNAIRVQIGSVTKVMLTDNILPLKDFNVTGKQKIRLTLINNLRNLLGPHHLEEGESYTARPTSFFKERSPWNSAPWNDDYCFVDFGI